MSDVCGGFIDQPKIQKKASLLMFFICFRIVKVDISVLLILMAKKRMTIMIIVMMTVLYRDEPKLKMRKRPTFHISIIFLVDMMVTASQQWPLPCL